MDTKDIPQNGPSDWRREPSERVTAVVGKLGEEASELASRCCRVLIQGLRSIDPDSKRSNLEHLTDEIADVEALIDLAKEHLLLSCEDISDRRDRKRRYKKPWVEALPNVGATDMDRMLNRFLGWRVPKNFAPDGGIKYTPPQELYPLVPEPDQLRPTGTNLLDATQARAMLEYVLGIKSTDSTDG